MACRRLRCRTDHSHRGFPVGETIDTDHTPEQIGATFAAGRFRAEPGAGRENMEAANRLAFGLGGVSLRRFPLCAIYIPLWSTASTHR